MFVNVPPGERTPASLPNPTKAAIQKQRIAEYNAALDARVDQFAAAHPASTVLKFDANAWFNKILNDYRMFGFSNITRSAPLCLPFITNNNKIHDNIFVAIAHARIRHSFGTVSKRYVCIYYYR